MGNRFHWTLKHNKLTRKENVAQARFKCNILTEISVSGIFFFQVLFENNRRLKSLSHNFFLFFFYWRMIALQNLLFSVKPQHESAIGIHTAQPFWTSPSPSPSTPLGWYRVPIWVSWVIQQIPVGYLFYIW